MRTVAALILGLFMQLQVAQAEVLMIDVTIKSIDPQDRLITVTKTSKTASKDLELEVARKAEIFVEGKEAPLDSVKPGQSASISYETELELVTKIDVSGKKTPAPEKTAEKVDYKTTGCRVIWTVSETGEATVEIGRPLRSRKPANKDLIRHDDGTVEAQYDLDNSKSVQRVMWGTTEKADNVGFNQSQKALVLTHKKGQPGGTARFTFSKHVQFPVTIEYEFDGLKEAKGFLVGINLRSLENIKFPFLNVASDDGFKSSAVVRPLWVESRDSKGSALIQQKMKPQTVELDETNEFTFQLPITDKDQRYLPEFGVLGEDASVALRYLSVRGRLTPMLGVALDERNGTVVAKNVFRNGLGKSIGMKDGDIIQKINGREPIVVEGAMKLIRELNFGEEAEIVLKRGTETIRLKFTVE